MHEEASPIAIEDAKEARAPEPRPALPPRDAVE